MSLSKLEFTKDWTNAEDFPTYELEEAKVRQDIQFLHDETKTFINNTIDTLDATQVPFIACPSVDAVTVQSAIENVQQQLVAVTQGSVADGSLTTAKYSDRSVTGVKIASGGVITDNLADGTVTEMKIADGAVSSAKIAYGAITSDKLAVTAFENKADLNGNKKVYPEQVSKDIVSVTGSKTLAFSDAGTFQFVNSASDITITVPAYETVALPVDTEIEIFRYGKGRVTVSFADNVSCLYPGEYNIKDQFSSAVIKKTSSNTWVMKGNIGDGVSAGKVGKNMLLNWDFRHPVNQRGASLYSAQGYTVDRWKFTDEYLTAQVQQGYISLSASSQGNGYFRQISENAFPAGIYTVSALIRGQEAAGLIGISRIDSEGNETGISSSIVSAVGNDWTLVSHTAEIADNGENNVFIKVDAASSVDVISVKLEKGSVSTLLNDSPANFGEQTALCQRYYYVIPTDGLINGFAFSYDNATWYAAFDVPTEMRAMPAVSAKTLYINDLNSGIIHLSTGASMHARHSARMIVSIDCKSGGAGHVGRIFDSAIAFDAEV